jgi:enoyl-CoA hydratase/carnithine racemase
MTNFTTTRADIEAVSERTLLFDVEDGIAWMTLNRPSKLNAINRAMIRGIAAVAATVAERDEIRVLIVRGAGRAFSAGGDLAEVGELMQDRDGFDGFLDEWHATFTALDECPKPVIGVAHGIAFAGGLELLHVCDVVVAGESARLGDQHAHYGLFPPGGGTQRLVRLVGPRHANWLLLSGESIDAAAAARIGLVNLTVPDSELDATVRAMAKRLRERSPRASAAILRALRQGEGLPVGEALRAERSVALDHMTSPDVQIGIAAFRNRTEPEF